MPRRPIRARLASGAAGVLSYTIELFNPAGVGLQLPGSQRRRSSLLLNYTRVVTGPDGEPYLVMSSRGPGLRVCFSLVDGDSPPRSLEVRVALGAMSAHDQRSWRRRVRYDPDPRTPDESLPQTWGSTLLRAGEGRGVAKRREDRALLARQCPARIHATCQDEETLLRYQRGDRYGPCLLRVDDNTTTNAIAAQLLAYLLQEEMVQWDDITPWMQQYDQRPLAAGTRYERIMQLAIPFEPNALRPPSPLYTEPGVYSLPQAAKMLGITERQLRYRCENRTVPGATKLGRRWLIPAETVEQMTQQVADQARRQQDKTRRTIFIERAKNVYGMTSDAIRQMIHRGARTPEGAPDFDALEAQLAHRHRRAKASEASEDVMSLEGKIAACDELLERLSPQSEEWEDVQEEREQLRQRLRGWSSLMDPQR